MQGRILIIDDEPEILNAVKFYLEDEDFEVHVTTDGTRAVELAESVRPDLIILDVMMPVLDGIQVCRQLRSRTRTRMIPIIFLTARESVEDKIRGLEAGGVDYITKPFVNQELLARIKAHIRLSQENLAGHPVTGLPGASSVEEEVNRRLHEGRIFTAVFAEVEHMQEYREAYGVSRGDRLLLQLSRMFEEEMENLARGEGFLGHASYYDFVFLCPPDKAEALCSRLVERFESEKGEFYLEQHRRRGELVYYDYRGNTVHAPLVKLVLGGVCNSRRFVATYTALAEWSAQALMKARSYGRSAFVLEE
ncbi:response regulator [Candidatus Solincola tengchongensis]|uniref:response regulator n=1 Tax=Candidatus Solincola tengchongensis TaxID=2900693 RepID=UPI00257CF9A8|nr:response regulator [Candidatus Solincola tengchongensis]